MTESDANIRMGTATGRWIVLATTLGSGLAQLDATVVNVALPRIGSDLGAGLTALQWTINAYTLTLAGLLLLGGSLGDRLGRRRVFLIGVLWFTLASIGCGLAPNDGVLIALRALQGVGGALLTPGSLAILQAVFRPDDRGAAVGAWSGLGAIASAIGPVLGGLLVGVAPWGWRLCFLINVPLAVVVVISSRHIPETKDPLSRGRLDIGGAVLASIGLAMLVFGLTEGPASGWTWATGGLTVAGVVLLIVFLLWEHRVPNPLLPLDMFRNRQFAGVNIVTLAVYAALSGGLFLLPVQLQVVSGFSPVAAGSALLPMTAIMALLSSTVGRLGQRIGPRLPMTVGPILAGGGLMMLSAIGPDAGYVTAVLPGVLVFALGLTMTVAPLTATALGSAPQERVGIASAINNDVARVAGLLAVAVLPGLAGITPEVYASPVDLSAGFHRAVIIAGAVCAAGGVLSFLLIRNPDRPTAPAPQDLPTDRPPTMSR